MSLLHPPATGAFSSLAADLPARLRLFVLLAVLIPLFGGLQSLLSREGAPRTEIRLVPQTVPVIVEVERPVERVAERIVYLPAPGPEESAPPPVSGGLLPVVPSQSPVEVVGPAPVALGPAALPPDVDIPPSLAAVDQIEVARPPAAPDSSGETAPAAALEAPPPSVQLEQSPAPTLSVRSVPIRRSAIPAAPAVAQPATVEAPAIAEPAFVAAPAPAPAITIVAPTTLPAPEGGAIPASPSVPAEPLQPTVAPIPASPNPAPPIETSIQPIHETHPPAPSVHEGAPPAAHVPERREERPVAHSTETKKDEPQATRPSEAKQDERSAASHKAEARKDERPAPAQAAVSRAAEARKEERPTQTPPEPKKDDHRPPPPAAAPPPKPSAPASPPNGHGRR